VQVAVVTGASSGIGAELARVLAQPLSVTAVNHLIKTGEPSRGLLGLNNSGSNVALGRDLVGYGSVYYDNFYDKPMIFFEAKGTLIEEPGCGYLKMSFSF